MKISKNDFLYLDLQKIIKKFAKEDVYITTDSKKVITTMKNYSKILY